MYVTRKTFAEFIFPQDEDDPFGSLNYTTYEVPPGERDSKVPSHPGGPPPEALGVRFYDIVAAEVLDPVTGTPIECRSTRLDLSGTTFYRGTIRTKSSMDPVMNSLLTDNGWDAAIEVDDVILPFRLMVDDLVV